MGWKGLLLIRKQVADSEDSMGCWQWTQVSAEKQATWASEWHALVCPGTRGSGRRMQEAVTSEMEGQLE